MMAVLANMITVVDDEDLIVLVFVPESLLTHVIVEAALFMSIVIIRDVRAD